MSITRRGYCALAMLLLLAILSATTWAQVTPAGNITCFDMANNPGQILVITDFYWEGEGPAGSTCVAHLTGGGAGWYFIKSGATVNSDGFTTKSEHLTTRVGTTANPGFAGSPAGSAGSLTPNCMAT